MKIDMKLVTATDPTLFEERLARTLSRLSRDDVIVDVKFSTCEAAGGVSYSALVHVQTTESWG